MGNAIYRPTIEAEGRTAAVSADEGIAAADEGITNPLSWAEGRTAAVAAVEGIGLSGKPP